MNQGKKLFNRIERLLQASPKYWHIAVVTRYGLNLAIDRSLEQIAKRFNIDESGAGWNGRKRNIGYMAYEEKSIKPFLKAIKKSIFVKKTLITQYGLDWVN